MGVSTSIDEVLSFVCKVLASFKILNLQHPSSTRLTPLCVSDLVS